ncbi:Roadblock/LC7 domain-containing protein [Thermovibrio guaymasensis]|uniref:Roadblock/LC7 domain-containing protein n=1 Tax=Thermovibrio guaymasensis TaxID=240167 RepID=A0A420W706_9BACT|nr:roadblock/LC7 domain-containing protein [Thermovibrio guaymasensis]RKQ61807.1 Roadblock/LC7 domain-containing protein [Thermovibrio guaymasensis]
MEELLKEVAQENPEVESVLVIDEEGIIVYRYDKETSIDPEEVATQLVNPLNTLSEFIQDISNEEDDLKELLLFSEKYQFLAYKLINETYLVVVAKRSPLYGRMRFRVRSKLPKLIKTL